MIRYLVLLTLLVVASSAAADPPFREVPEINFENDDIEGETMKPNLDIVLPGVEISGPDPLLVKAEALFDAGDMAGATSRYEVVIDLDGPEANYARYKLGWCQLNLANPKLALEHFTALNTRLQAQPAGKQRDALMRAVGQDVVLAASQLDDVAEMKAVAATVCLPHPSRATCVSDFTQALSRQLTEAGRGAEAQQLQP